MHTLRAFQSIVISPFLEYGAKLYFELNTPLPNIEKYKFEIILCDDFRIIRLPDKEPVISKGMINFRVIKNETLGRMQSDNTTLKHFYDVNYSKSDRSKSSNYLNSIIDSKTEDPICNFIL